MYFLLALFFGRRRSANDLSRHCHPCFGAVGIVNHHVIGLQRLPIECSKRRRMLYQPLPVWFACGPDCVDLTGVDLYFCVIYDVATCYFDFDDCFHYLTAHVRPYKCTNEHLVRFKLPTPPRQMLPHTVWTMILDQIANRHSKCEIAVRQYYSIWQWTRKAATLARHIFFLSSSFIIFEESFVYPSPLFHAYGL